MAIAASVRSGRCNPDPTRSARVRWSSWVRAIRLVMVCALVMVTAVVAGSSGAVAGPAALAVVDPTTLNLVQNGSFETGGTLLNPWIFRHDISAALTPGIGGVDGTQAANIHVAATSPSTFLVQLRQENLHLQAGDTYTLSFSAKASAPRLINARLQSPLAPYPTFIARDFTLSTTWQQFTFEYTARTGTANAFVGFNLAQATGDVDIDQVALTDNNMVTNGGFEDPATLAPWIWRNDVDATFTRDTTTRFDGAASAEITVPTIGTAGHVVQLRQPIPAVVAGEHYRVAFSIKASRTRTANVRLQSVDAPYPTAVTNNLTVTTSWTRVSFDWAPKVTLTNPFLGFNLAQDTGNVWLDDITLTHQTGTVVAWGDNLYGQATPPAGLTDVIAIAAGAMHSLALKSGGTVVAWGNNMYGGATPPAGLTGVTAVAAGVLYSLALKRDGTVVGWGYNLDGEASPPAGLTDVTAIAAGQFHSLALKSDGTVVVWGNNQYGQATPPAGLTDVTAIAAGDFHSLALKRDGTVVGWGRDEVGEATPPAGLTDVTAIAAGRWHSLALKRDGTVVGWGYNYGQVTPPAGLTGVVAIAAGPGQSLALKNDGTVVGWGSNGYGQVTPPAGLTGVVAIAAGGYHSLALKM